MSFLLCLFLLVSLLSAQDEAPPPVQEALTLFRFENLLPDTSLTGFNVFLSEKFTHELQTGFAVSASDRLFETMHADSMVRGSLRIALLGRFDKGPDGTAMLRFKIRDVKSGTEEEKIIAVSYMDREDIAQIVLLKTRSFLARSILGTVAVTSSPLGLNVSLDGKPQGRTPREFLLKSGAYQLEIRGEHFHPYRENFTVVPGRALNLGAAMEFKGYPTHYWLLGAAAVTWELMVMWVLEGNYDRESRHYRNVHNIRITLLSLSGIGWIGTSYCFFSNKSLKNKLLAKKN
ncbi:MAG: PEGA domain-containing protein [Fibrobacterota bacterium]